MTSPVSGAGLTPGAKGTEGAKAREVSAQHAKLRQVSQQLEAVFMGQLMQAMRQSVPDDGIAPRSQGEQMFTAMMDEHFAQSAAERSRGGLSDALYRQLSRMLPAETSK